MSSLTISLNNREIIREPLGLSRLLSGSSHWSGSKCQKNRQPLGHRHTSKRKDLWINFHGKIKETSKLLLMEEILHQLILSLSHYLQAFIHPRWSRISSINSITPPTWIFKGLCLYLYSQPFKANQEIHTHFAELCGYPNCNLPASSKAKPQSQHGWHG